MSVYQFDAEKKTTDNILCLKQLNIKENIQERIIENLIQILMQLHELNVYFFIALSSRFLFLCLYQSFLTFMKDHLR
jgi:hypothetical protein